jgi:predicted solute-binding protein
MEKKYKVDQQALNQYYSACISIKYNTKDIKELEELIKKH